MVVLFVLATAAASIATQARRKQRRVNALRVLSHA